MSNKPKHHHRGQFTSSLGFILAAAGSAIGLGNLWKFPYIAGNSGGGYFLLFYIAFVLVLGIPITLAEMSLGRSTELSAVGAYRKINKNWTFVGGIGVLCAFVILSYYSVVGGWVLKYIAAYLTGGQFGGDYGAYFDNFVASPVEPVVWHLVFMAFCALVVVGGVAKGIEKASKIMLPALFVLIVVVAVRACTLPGAAEGLKFFFVPNAEPINTPSKFINVIVLAMGQVFFSLSLGMGITITYGSYLKKNDNMVKSTMLITSLDSLVAVLAGMAIIPAVFALSSRDNLTAGPGLIFKTLPAVFDSMPLGVVFGLLFFILVFFAAATSAIALLEVVSAFLIDTLHWKRRTATISMAAVMALIGVFASLSMGTLSGFTIGGMNLFDAMGFLTDKILMPVSALLTCIFVGYVWGIDKAAEEVEQGGVAFRLRKAFAFCVRYLAPVLILVIFVMGLVNQ